MNKTTSTGALPDEPARRSFVRTVAGAGLMALSLSPGPSYLEQSAHLQANANQWRVCNDFWDTWPQAPAKSPSHPMARGSCVALEHLTAS